MVPHGTSCFACASLRHCDLCPWGALCCRSVVQRSDLDCAGTIYKRSVRTCVPHVRPNEHAHVLYKRFGPRKSSIEIGVELQSYRECGYQVWNRRENAEKGAKEGTAQSEAAGKGAAARVVGSGSGVIINLISILFLLLHLLLLLLTPLIHLLRLHYMINLYICTACMASRAQGYM